MRINKSVLVAMGLAGALSGCKKDAPTRGAVSNPEDARIEELRAVQSKLEAALDELRKKAPGTVDFSEYISAIDGLMASGLAADEEREERYEEVKKKLQAFEEMVKDILAHVGSFEEESVEDDIGDRNLASLIRSANPRRVARSASELSYEDSEDDSSDEGFGDINFASLIRSANLVAGSGSELSSVNNQREVKLSSVRPGDREMRVVGVPQAVVKVQELARLNAREVALGMEVAHLGIQNPQEVFLQVARAIQFLVNADGTAELLVGDHKVVALDQLVVVLDNLLNNANVDADGRLVTRDAEQLQQAIESVAVETFANLVGGEVVVAGSLAQEVVSKAQNARTIEEALHVRNVALYALVVQLMHLMNRTLQNTPEARELLAGLNAAITSGDENSIAGLIAQGEQPEATSEMRLVAAVAKTIATMHQGELVGANPAQLVQGILDGMEDISPAIKAVVIEQILAIATIGRKVVVAVDKLIVDKGLIHFADLPLERQNQYIEAAQHALRKFRQIKAESERSSRDLLPFEGNNIYELIEDGSNSGRKDVQEIDSDDDDVDEIIIEAPKVVAKKPTLEEHWYAIANDFKAYVDQGIKNRNLDYDAFYERVLIDRMRLSHNVEGTNAITGIKWGNGPHARFEAAVKKGRTFIAHLDQCAAKVEDGREMLEEYISVSKQVIIRSSDESAANAFVQSVTERIKEIAATFVDKKGKECTVEKQEFTEARRAIVVNVLEFVKDVKKFHDDAIAIATEPVGRSAAPNRNGAVTLNSVKEAEANDIKAKMKKLNALVPKKDDELAEEYQAFIDKVIEKLTAKAEVVKESNLLAFVPAKRSSNHNRAVVDRAELALAVEPKLIQAYTEVVQAVTSKDVEPFVNKYKAEDAFYTFVHGQTQL